MEPIATLTMNPTIDVSTTVDRLEPGAKLRCSAPRRTPGGGGINVARGLQRLGAQVRAVYPAGGHTADTLDALAEGEGLERVVVPTSAAVRESFAVEVEEPGELYHFVLPGPELQEPEWRRCLETVAGLDPRPAWLVASGSLPPGVPADFYARLARTASDADMRLVLDTSGEALEQALAAGVHLLRTNRREFEELSGRSLEDPASREPALRELVDAGRAEVVVVSLGDEGAVLCSRDAYASAAPPPVTGRSPVGAGDSFVALLVYRLAGGHDLRDALDHAVAAAAAAVTNPGSELYAGDEIGRMVRRMRETRGGAGPEHG